MFNIQIYGDQGMRIQFGNEISIETNERIRSFIYILEKENIQGIIEWIPTYTAVTIYYNPLEITYESLKEKVLQIQNKLNHMTIPKARIVEIPTCYDHEFAFDLSTVAQHNGLDEEEVIALHHQETYLVYMIGFAPGFPYLGGMDKRIATPRLAVPRQEIPAGSVGIAGEQTGIYPLATPGGWQLIGRTPLKLYDPEQVNPFLLEAGDYIQFIPIARETYEEIKCQVEMNTYEIVVKEMD